MIVLAVAAVIGSGALLAGFACWVLSLFDQQAIERERKRPLPPGAHRVLTEAQSEAAWHDGEWIDP